MDVLPLNCYFYFYLRASQLLNERNDNSLPRKRLTEDSSEPEIFKPLRTTSEERWKCSRLSIRDYGVEEVIRNQLDIALYRCHRQSENYRLFMIEFFSLNTFRSWSNSVFHFLTSGLFIDT